LSLPGRHAPAAQQPFGHDVPSQTHAPEAQCWPSAQAPPMVPHAQTPVDRQRSAVIPQVVQVPPLDPQLVTAGAWQVVPAQQPPRQETLSHTQLPCAQR
jgi:hypothetical protein